MPDNTDVDIRAIQERYQKKGMSLEKIKTFLLLLKKFVTALSNFENEYSRLYQHRSSTWYPPERSRSLLKDLRAVEDGLLELQKTIPELKKRISKLREIILEDLEEQETNPN